MVARHGNDILVVTDLEKVLYDDAVDRAASHSQAGVSTSGNNRPFCFSGVDDCWETSCYTYGHYLLSLSHRDLARRCRPSQSMKYTCMLKIVTGLPWEHFQFCAVVSHSSLPSTHYLIMRSLPHYALLV